MATRHQKHLMAAKQRKERKAMEEQNKSETIDQKAVIMDTDSKITKAKNFVRRHKKAFIIGGSLAAAALAAVVAHKAIKNSNANYFRAGEMSAWGFAKPARDIALKEIKIEKKALNTHLVNGKLKISKRAENGYEVAENGTVRNTCTNRILTPFKHNDGQDWVAVALNEKALRIEPVQALLDTIYGDSNTVTNDTQVTS